MIEEALQRLPAEALHQRFIEILGKDVLDHSELSEKPLLLDLALPLPPKIRLYLHNATHPPGGRTTGEHKIQLMVPGQTRDSRGNFDYSDGRLVYLVGYQQELDVFILWDPGLYRDFPFSRNVQVHPQTIYAAYAGQVVEQQRILRGQGTEVIVAAHARNLRKAIQRRQALTVQRLTRTHLWQDSEH